MFLAKVHNYFYIATRRVLPIQLIRQGSVHSTADNGEQKFKPDYQNVSILQDTSEEVKQAYSLKFASKREKNKDKVANIREQLQLRDGDTGSAPVQVGVLTVRIKYLTDHMVYNKKDKSCLRALLSHVHKRRKLLRYIRQRDFECYHTLLKDLEIRPIPENKYAYVKKK